MALGSSIQKTIDVATANVTLTDTHAHGLARHFLSLQMQATHEAYRAALSEFQEIHPPRTTKGVRRLFRSIESRLSGHAWFQSTWSNRQETTGVWVLPLFKRDQLDVVRVTVSAPTTRRMRWRAHDLLSIHLHAIARGHQRLHESEWPAVEQELRTCVLYANAVAEVAKQRSHLGFGIPALNGLLIGEINDGCPVAKTFITPPLAPRHERLLDAWVAFTISRPDQQMDEFAALMLGAENANQEDLIDALGSALSSRHLDYLKRPHEPMEDPVTALWEAAREQSRRDSD